MRTIVPLFLLTTGFAGGQTIPVKVAAGETATIAKHVTANPRERFSVNVGAGQTLLVVLSDYDGAVQVFGPGAGGTKPLQSADLGESNWMNPLPKAGTYEIAVRPKSKKPYDLWVTLMDSRDPRLDPGIAADKVALDLGALGGRSKLALEPFRPALGEELDDPWPANLFVQKDHLEVRIMSLEGLRKRMVGDKQYVASLARLEASLKPGAKPGTPEQFPPGYSDSAMLFSARMEFLEGASVRGVRYVGQFAQEDLSPTESLTYVFYGISRDGKTFVVVRGEITFPGLPKTQGPVHAGPKLKALQADATRRLSAAKPDAFQPALGQLDAIAKSLKLP